MANWEDNVVGGIDWLKDSFVKLQNPLTLGNQISKGGDKLVELGDKAAPYIFNDYISGYEEPKFSLPQLPVKKEQPNQGTENTNLKELFGTDMGNYFKGLNTPGKPDNTGIQSKVGKMKEFTRAPVERPVGFGTGEKIGIMGNALGNFFESFDGRGTEDMSRDLNNVVGRIQGDKDRLYENALMNEQADREVQQLNNMVAQQAAEEQMSLNKLINDQEQQSFANRFGLMKAKAGLEQGDRALSVKQLIANTKAASELDQKMTMKAFDILAKRDPSWYQKSNEEKAVDLGVLKEQLKAAMGY